MIAPLLIVAALFARISLLAVGGVNSTVPEISQQVVELRHWFTPLQFSQLYAIANAAPGPNGLIATLIGGHVAGIPGAIVATLAMILPAGILVILVSRLWERFPRHRWRRVLQAAILPITAGLLLSASVILIRSADHDFLAFAITAAVAVFSYRNVHPLWLLAGGAALGLVFG